MSVTAVVCSYTIVESTYSTCLTEAKQWLLLSLLTEEGISQNICCCCSTVILVQQSEPYYLQLSIADCNGLVTQQ